MALYLGSDERIINLGGVAYCLRLTTKASVTSGTRLLSSDTYMLLDSNGVCLLAKEIE